MTVVNAIDRRAVLTGGIMFSALQERLAADGFTPSRSTLYTWLAMEKRAGTIVQPDGDKSPYVAARFRQP